MTFDFRAIRSFPATLSSAGAAVIQRSSVYTAGDTFFPGDTFFRTNMAYVQGSTMLMQRDDELDAASLSLLDTGGVLLPAESWEPAGGGAGTATAEEPTETAEEPTEIEELSGYMGEDRTLTADTRWLIAGRYDVDATRTVEPGTTLAFEAGAGVRVLEAGELTADGSADAAITFTGTEAEPGWWDGIHFYDSTASGNVLNHCVVEYAGGERSGNVEVGTRLRDAQVALRDSELRDGEAWGICVHADGSANDDVCEVNEFDGNVSGSCVVE